MTDPARRHVLRCLLAAGGLALAGCGRSEAPAPAPMPSAAAGASAPAAARVHVVGADAAYAPFESQNEKGEVVGFSVDLLNAVAAKAGLTLKYVNTPWEGIFNALAQGDRDLLISSITITAERRQTMDFSDPYFDAAQLIAAPAASTIAKFDDLKTLKVGVQTGTTGDEVVTRLQGKTSANVRRFESTPLALKELEAGGVDAVVADNGVIVHHVANNPGAKFRTIADPAFEPEQYGIAVRKGDAELLTKVNRGLAAIKADGTYAKLYAKTFGSPPPPAGPALAASR